MTSGDDLEVRARAGDPEAFGAFIRRHDRELRGVVWAVVRSPEVTDDVMQTAYEKAFRSLGSFDGRSALTTWLHSICYRTALDHIRYEGRRRHEDVDEVVLHSVAPSPESVVLTRAEIVAAFDSLPPKDRVLLMLIATFGATFDEAAEITGLRRGTVASRVSRARARIQRWEQT